MRVLLTMLLTVTLWGYEDFVQQAYYDSYKYEKTQDYTAAIKALSGVHERYPKAYTPNLRLGWLFYLNKNYANALKHYSAAVSIVPTSIEAKLGLILVYQAQTKHKDARRLINDILQDDPYNYFANRYLVTSLNDTDEFDSALKTINKMLAVYPTDVFFLSKLALVYEKKNLPELALSVYADVIILDPANADAIEYFKRK